MSVSSNDTIIEFKPQPRQELFLSSPADIAIYGGAAGGGKTWSLLLEPLRHLRNPRFGAVIFRRTLPEIIKEGGMWDEALDIYPLLGGEPNQNQHKFEWDTGAKITFASMQYEASLREWRGAQIAFMGFDQLETFTQKQFFYMLSRNRSTSGVTPYIRATCNPEPGWLADFLSWWIADDGYADLDRVGKLRWFVRAGEELVWGNSYEELEASHPDLMPAKSVTFIVSTIYDNKILMESDPSYLGNLKALDYVDRARLLGDRERGGNWKIKPSAGTVFNREWFQKIQPKEVPDGGTTVRFWDLAATDEKFAKKKKKGKDPDFTASWKMKKVGDAYYILHVTQERLSPARTDERMREMAQLDGPWVAQRWEHESGASGVRDSHHIATHLDGFDAKGERPEGDKIMRAKPFAAQVFAGNVYYVEAPWNEMMLEHMHAQPEWPHDDVMDAGSGCYKALSKPIKKARSLNRR